MKKMKCSDMGGPCDKEIMANSWEEMKKEGMKHLERKHADMAEDMKKMSPEDLAKWDAEGKAKFDALPEM